MCKPSWHPWRIHQTAFLLFAFGHSSQEPRFAAVLAGPVHPTTQDSLTPPPPLTSPPPLHRLAAMSLARMRGASSTFALLAFIAVPEAAGRTRLGTLDAQTCGFRRFGRMVIVSPSTRGLLQHVALRLDERTGCSLQLTLSQQAQALHLLLPMLEAALTADEEAQAEARGHRDREAAASGGGRRPGPDMSLRRPALLLLTSLSSPAAGTDEEQHLHWLLEGLTADQRREVLLAVDVQRTAQAGATLQVEHSTTLYSALGEIWAWESGYRGGLLTSAPSAMTLASTRNPLSSTC